MSTITANATVNSTASEKPMTSREFYELVKSIATNSALDSVVVSDSALNEQFEQAYQYAIAQLEKLDAKNLARKDKPTKAHIESADRQASVMAVLTDEPMTRDQIAELVGITPSQATGALTQLARNGFASKTEVKDGKSKKMGYTIAK